MINSSVVSIPKDADLMLMLEDKSIVKLKAIESTIASTGAGAIGHAGSGAIGFGMRYSVTSDDVEMLLKGIVTKMRVYLRDSYMDLTIEKKHAETIPKALQLIQNKE